MPAVTFGKTPRDNIGRSIPLKELQDVRKSGFYNLIISSASIKAGISSKGYPWEQLNLGLAVIANGNPIARMYVSEFISQSSQRLQDLCYFAGLRDSEGNIYCPAARTFTYTDKNTGEEKTASSIDEFQGAEIWAVVDYTGERALNNGNTVPQYTIHLCNRFGQTATEESSEQDPAVLKPMLDKLKISLPVLTSQQKKVNANAVSVNAQPQAQPQVQPQPKQTANNPFSDRFNQSFGTMPGQSAVQPDVNVNDADLPF